MSEEDTVMKSVELMSANAPSVHQFPGDFRSERDDRDIETLVVPAGASVIRFEPAGPPPRVKQTFNAADLESFLRYVQRQDDWGGRMAIYADFTQRKLLAILDHAVDGRKPGTNDHRACLSLNLSADALAIEAVLGSKIEQADFLEWVEDNARLFAEASTLITVAGAFESVQVTKFRSVKRLQNGTQAVFFDTEEDAEKSVKVPQDVTATVPIFEGQKPQELRLKLRYRVEGGRLYFMFVCPGYATVIKEACDQMWSDLQAWSATFSPGHPVLLVRGNVTVQAGLDERMQKYTGGLLPTALTYAPGAGQSELGALLRE